MKTWPEMLEQIESAGPHLAERTIARLSPDQEPFEESLAKLHGLLGIVVNEAVQNGWPQRKIALAGLYTYCMRGLVNSYRMALQGYSADAIILLRSTFEGLWLAIDLDLDSTIVTDAAELRIDRWMSGAQHVAMRDVLRRRGEHHETLRDRWKSISQLCHPGSVGAVALAFNKAPIGEAPDYLFGVLGIERPELTVLVVDVAWAISLALIHYSPLAFGASEATVADTADWVTRARAQFSEFETKHMQPVWQ